MTFHSRRIYRAVSLSQDNLIEEGYFDNCYAFEQFLEDVQHRRALLDRVAALEATLARIGNPTAGGTG